MSLHRRVILVVIVLAGRGSGRMTSEPVDSLEQRAEHARLCTEEHHTYFVDNPPMPLPEHEVMSPWGLSMRFPVSKEELVVEIYYSLGHKITYPKMTNATFFGVFTKSYDGKFWVYTDLMLPLRPNAKLFYWLSMYVTNGTHYKFVHHNHQMIYDVFNRPNQVDACANFRVHKAYDRILQEEGDILERYFGYKKFRY